MSHSQSKMTKKEGNVVSPPIINVSIVLRDIWGQSYMSAMSPSAVFCVSLDCSFAWILAFKHEHVLHTYLGCTDSGPFGLTNVWPAI